MLSSVSLGAGLKTRPTPPNAAPPTPSSPKQDARHCVFYSCLVGAGASFGELCVLGLSTVSLVDATCVVQSDFFFIHRDRFLNAFSNLPEVLAEMAAREDVYRRRPVRVPKASLGSG